MWLICQKEKKKKLLYWLVRCNICFYGIKMITQQEYRPVMDGLAVNLPHASCSFYYYKLDYPLA